MSMASTALVDQMQSLARDEGEAKAYANDKTNIETR